MKRQIHKDLRISISQAVDNKSSIDLNDVEDMAFSIKPIEEVLKNKKVRYRVRTEKRTSIPLKAAGGGAAIIGASVAMEVAAVAAPIAVGMVAIAGAALTGVGAVALAGIAAHRIFTASPDYEIVCYPNEKKIRVIYKK